MYPLSGGDEGEQYDEGQGHVILPHTAYTNLCLSQGFGDSNAARQTVC